MFAIPDLKPDEVLIYLRKSRTDDPALTVSETVARHEQMLDEYSMTKWGELVPEQNRFREVFSGETIAARPEVQKVLRLIEQPQFKAVLIVEPQRLSRGDLEDIGRLTKLFRYTGTIIITLQGIFDLSDARDRDFFERELMRGNDYLEYSKRIMQNGLRLCVENGQYMGSVPPYGYKHDSYKENKRTIHTLAIVPDEADAVRLIFQMYAAGNGCSTICQVLNNSGVRPRQADIWRPPVIYRILDNPHYIGLVRYDYRKTERVVVDGEIVKQRAKRHDVELYEGKHPAIIDRDLWDEVQRARKKRHLPRVRSHLDIQNPLAGIMYCECGSVMVKASQTKGRGIRIHCKDQIHCGNAGCTIDVLMQKIAQQIRAEIDDLHVTAATSQTDAEAASGRVRMLSARLDALTAKQDALWEKLAEGMPRDTFDRLIAKNEREKEECAAMLKEAREIAESSESAEMIEATLYATLDMLRNQKDAPPKELNSMLRMVLRRVTYRRDRAYKDDSGNVIRPEPEIHVELNI